MGFFKPPVPPPPLPKSEITSSVNETEVHLGDEIKGSVGVKSGEELDIEEIWVELRCFESKKKIRRYQDGNLVWHEKEYWDKADIYSGPFSHLPLSRNMHVKAGFDKLFSFMVKIPSYGRETFASADDTINWLLTEYVAVKGYKYAFKTKGSQIFVTKPSVSNKEVVREVVLIPCAYCGGLMPQTSTICPSCGARRKS